MVLKERLSSAPKTIINNIFDLEQFSLQIDLIYSITIVPLCIYIVTLAVVHATYVQTQSMLVRVKACPYTYKLKHWVNIILPYSQKFYRTKFSPMGAASEQQRQNYSPGKNFQLCSNEQPTVLWKDYLIINYYSIQHSTDKDRLLHIPSQS